VDSKPPGTGLHYDQGTIDITAKKNDSDNLQAAALPEARRFKG